jgi:hypothetical protein
MMRIIWLVFGGLLALMVMIVPRLSQHASTPTPNTLDAPTESITSPNLARAVALRTAVASRADSVVAFGLAQQGTPYVYAGTSPLTGFDCSGFILYTFAHFGVAVPHSTALLIDVGRPVARTEAQPGDIVVFTGTAQESTTPGHAGIVISRRGEVPLRFVHASSSRREPFVKVSQVENSDYERRFMQVRRVLVPGTSTAVTPRPKLPVPAALPPIGALRTRPVAVETTPTATTALPQKLATKKLPKLSVTTTRNKPVAKAPTKKPTTKKKASPAVKHKAPTKAQPRTKKPATSARKRPN